MRTGTVSLYNGSTLLTTALTVSSTGGYTFTTSSLPAGVQSITARYSGDATHTIAYASLSETVQANTSTTLVSSSNPSVYGQYVVFTATVTAPAGVSVGGSVTFTIDGTASSPITLSSGKASYSTSGLSVASHTVTATFLGTSALERQQLHDHANGEQGRYGDGAGDTGGGGEQVHNADGHGQPRVAWLRISRRERRLLRWQHAAGHGNA